MQTNRMVASVEALRLAFAPPAGAFGPVMLSQGEGFVTAADVRALRMFARKVGELPGNDRQLQSIVEHTPQLARWMWAEPRLIRCADIAATGEAWPVLEEDLRRLVVKIQQVSDQLQPLGTELLAEFDQALACEALAEGPLDNTQRHICAGAAKRLQLFGGYARRGALLSSGIGQQAQVFTFAMRTQALPALRKLWVAASADLDAEPVIGDCDYQAFHDFRALLGQLLLGDTAEVGASALFDACALLHDYIHCATERLVAIEDKAQLLEFILCLDEVLNLWRDVYCQAGQALAALQ